MTKKILVIKMSSLGDQFHPLPAVHALKLGLDADVHWVTHRQYVDLVNCFSDVERVIGFPRHGTWSDFRAFLRELRRDRELRGLSVIVLTSSNEPHDRAAAFQYEVEDYIVKPHSFNEFATAIKTVIIDALGR